jgi:O-antigen/teichoic acid export membrane protein
VAWNQRCKNFSRSSKVAFVGNLSSKVGVIGIGSLLNPTGIGLLFGDVIKSTIFLFFQTKQKVLRVITKKLFYLKDFSDSIRVFKEYRNVPKYIFPSQLINRLAGDLPLLLMGYFYSSEILGHYVFALTIIGIPQKLLSNSLSPVVYQKGNELSENKPMFYDYNRKLLFVHTFIILLSTALLALVSPTLFPMIFGKEWGVSGEIVKLIAIQYGLGMVLSPFTAYRRILKQEKRVFLLNIFSLIFRLFPLILFLVDLDFFVFVKTYVIIVSIYYLINLTDLIINTISQKDYLKMLTFVYLMTIMSYFIINAF